MDQVKYLKFMCFDLVFNRKKILEIACKFHKQRVCIVCYTLHIHIFIQVSYPLFELMLVMLVFLQVVLLLVGQLIKIKIKIEIK